MTMHVFTICVSFLEFYVLTLVAVTFSGVNRPVATLR